MKTCLIADDHLLLREALAGMIHMGWPDAVILQSGDFISARQQAEHKPDLIIVDLVMPGASPREGIQSIIKVAPDSRILVVTGTQDDELLLDLLQMGVSGFAPKTSSSAILDAAIRLILAGGYYLPPRMIDIAAARLEDGASVNISNTNIVVAERLTDRQMDVLRLMVKGQSNKEIARSLELSPSTVKSHISQILICLGAANRTDAAIKARLIALV